MKTYKKVLLFLGLFLGAFSSVLFVLVVPFWDWAINPELSQMQIFLKHWHHLIIGISSLLVSIFCTEILVRNGYLKRR